MRMPDSGHRLKNVGTKPYRNIIVELKQSIKQAREGRKVKIGYLEEKMINGYGPYLYFRYWEEGIHRSIYIGKKEE